MSYATAAGYLLVDSRKCQGCQSCMMVCSLVHEGEINLSLARIQVMQDILRNWPDDISIAQCRQCVDPACVAACPTGALHVDEAHGNTRVIDAAQCVGCQQCIEACPFIPERIIWNPATMTAAKCDLCLDTPYWDKTGGPGGRQACVEICPQRAIRFTEEIPEQSGDAGYEVSLREGEQG